MMHVETCRRNFIDEIAICSCNLFWPHVGYRIAMSGKDHKPKSGLLDLHPDAVSGSARGFLRWFSTNPVLFAIQIGFWASKTAHASSNLSPAEMRAAHGYLWLFGGYAAVVSALSLKYDLFRTRGFLALQPAGWFPAILPALAAVYTYAVPAAASAARTVVQSTPASELAFLQAIRIVSIGLLVKAKQGAFPKLLALLAGVPDVVYALSAVVLGRSLQSAESLSAVISHSNWNLWNAAGIAVVIMAGSGAAAISLPGPLYKFRGKDSMLAVLQFPMVLAPSVVAPMLICSQIAAMLWCK
jgi:hypothetical protein